MTDLSSMSDDDLRAAHAASSLSHMSDDELRAAHAASARSSPSAFESGMLGAVDTAGFGLGPAISGLTAASGMTPTRGYENQPHLDPNPLMPLVGAGRMINEKLIKPLTGGQPNDEVGQAYDRGRQSALDAINQAKQAHPNAYLAGQVGGAFAAPGFGVAGGATTAARIARGAGAGAIGGGLYGAGEAIGQGESPGETALAAGRGALTGAPLGAAGAGVAEALAPVAGRVANVIRGIRDPEEEASRRVATAMTRDWQSQGPSLTAEEIAAANAAGLPRSVIDAGGETTRALARSAANTSPEARAALAEMARDRFEDQSPRIAAFIRDITGGANAGADLETLQAAARRANQPAYKAAYAAGSGGVWTPELERLAGAPAVRQAMQDAVQRGRDRAVSEGLGAFNPGVTFENGVMQFGRGKGAPPYPDIQFWDYVQRELRDSANVAKRSGRNEEYGAITGLRRRLLGELDTQVPEFATARNGAAQFLGADNALEAGEKFVNFRPGGRNEMDFRKTYARMSQPERELFARGYASKLASNIEAVADNRSVLNAAFVNSGPARQRTLLALGPQRAAQLEALLRAEKITDLARQNMGNSSTARQLVELGLAGGSEGVLKQNFNLSHILVEAFRGAVRHGAQVIDGRVAERVGQMLASSDPNVLRQGLQLVARQPRLLNALRQASNRLGYAATAATQPQQGFKHGGAVDSTTERKPPPLSTRKQSNYSPTAGTKARHCANCAHYLKPNKCSEVGGFIAARGLCEWYRGQRAAGGRVDAGNINHAPTEAQKEAGNYAKDHIRVHGLDIAIENAKGAERSGAGKDGKPWSVKMPAHYGYIKRTEGADGDHVDVYLGPHTKSRKVFVVDQRDADTSDFDEHKVMMGFGTQKQAREAYHRGFSDGRGRERLGHMTEMGVDEFKDWLKHGNQSRPAFADGGALSDDDIAAQDAAEAAAARVRAPYAKANARASGLPDVVNYFGNKLASAVTAPRDALYGTMQVTDPETGMPTREAMERGQGVANMAMTGGIPFAQKGAAGVMGGRLKQPTIEHGKPVEVEAYKGSHPYANEPDRDWKGNVIKDYGPRRQLMAEEPFKSSAGHAGFFSSDPAVASRFAEALSQEGAVFPVKINFNNPYVIDGKGQPAASWQWDTIAKRHGMMNELEEYQAALKDPRYDGVVIKNTKDEGDVYIPKAHSQLKPGLFPDEPASALADQLPERKGLKVSDDGIRINIAPHDMQVPEWGKGLSWGLTAYRSKVNGEDAIHVRDARLPPEMRGQGHGTAMYEHAADLAAKEGKPLLSDGAVTQDAANRWMALNRAGYNVQMAPDKVFRPGPPEAPHLGRFETPDGSPVFRVEPAAAPGITAYHIPKRARGGSIKFKPDWWIKAKARRVAFA